MTYLKHGLRRVGDQLRMKATLSGCSLRAEAQMSPAVAQHAWLCLPHLSLVPYSAPMTWPWLRRRCLVRCVAIFWGHGHHAGRPEPGRRVAGAGAVQRPRFFSVLEGHCCFEVLWQ